MISSLKDIIGCLIQNQKMGSPIIRKDGVINPQIKEIKTASLYSLLIAAVRNFDEKIYSSRITKTAKS